MVVRDLPTGLPTNSTIAADVTRALRSYLKIDTKTSGTVAITALTSVLKSIRTQMSTVVLNLRFHTVFNFLRSTKNWRLKVGIVE